MCAYRAAGWHYRPFLHICSSSMPASALAAAPACRRARALGVRYLGAAAGAEKAHSRLRHWCLWSKLVIVGTWSLVFDAIRRCRVKIRRSGHNFGQTHGVSRLNHHLTIILMHSRKYQQKYIHKVTISLCGHLGNKHTLIVAATFRGPSAAP